ncbi:class D beta-lactamase [Desulfolutivibrio sp.]|uniref:class D beta-lactamase n=1 Tax=Desulfolutivibrio sp. TaxID=2773296 RepID=UPI002F96C262
MPRFLFFALLSCCLALPGLTASAAWAGSAALPGMAVTDRPDWGRHFAAAGVTGTMVLSTDGDAPTVQAYDPARAATGFLPASTFKIPNSLIALETGVVAGPDTVFAWDGVKRPIEAWNADLTFTKALRVSSVPIYQEIARRIGQERMQWWVREMGYGNADIGQAIDTFWLDGKLRISALEQAAFLRRLAHDQLPFSAKTMAAVREMLVEERTESGVLRAKTGLTARVSPNVGWWVGWVEKGDGRWFFALNMDSVRPEDVPARKVVAKAVLAAEGVWP